GGPGRADAARGERGRIHPGRDRDRADRRRRPAGSGVIGDGMQKKPRDVTPAVREDRERSLEATLRPQRLSDDEYINQDKVKSNLQINIEATMTRGAQM